MAHVPGTQPRAQTRAASAERRSAAATGEVFGGGAARAAVGAAQSRGDLAVRAAETRGRGEVAAANATMRARVALAQAGRISAFGEGLEQLGEAGMEIGLRMAEAENRLERLREAGARGQIVRTLEPQLLETFERAKTTGAELLSKESLAAYGKEISDLGTAALQLGAAHSKESRFLLAEQVDGLIGKYHGFGVEAGVTGLRAVAERQLVERNNERVQEVRANPSLLAQKIGEHKRDTAEFTLTDTDDQVADKLAAGVEDLALAAAETMNAMGQHGLARDVLADNAKFISEGKATSLSVRITAAEVREDSKASEIAATKARLEAAGVKMTPALAIAIEGITLPRLGPKTKQQLVDESNAALQQANMPALGGDSLLKFLGALPPDEGDERGLFGNRMKGLATVVADDLVVRFSLGQTTAEEDRTYVSALTILARPAPGTDILSPVGLQHNQALLARDMDPEALFDPVFAASQPSLLGQAPETGNQLSAMRDRERQQLAAMAEGGQLPATAPPSLDPRAQQLLEREPAVVEEVGDTARSFPELGKLLGGKTIAEFAETGFTGPGPAIQEFFGRMPFVGSGAGVVDTVRTALPLTEERLVTALQQSLKFAVMERAQIQEKVSIDPTIWDNPQAFLGRLVGVATFIRTVIVDLDVALKKPQPKVQRQKDRVTKRLLEDWLELALPHTIYETDDAKIQKQVREFIDASPPGTPLVYLNSSGNWVIGRTPSATVEEQ